jgi:uncharacterized membrane protein
MGMGILYSTETPRHNASEMAWEERELPAWQRPTDGEHIFGVCTAIVVAIGLMLALPPRISNKPHWLLPAVAVVLLALILMSAREVRLHTPRPKLRVVGIVLIGLLSLANASSGTRLVVDILRGKGLADGDNPTKLLLAGGAIWLTNVIVFAIWYWGADRGGAVQRALATDPNPDLLFPQMQLDQPWVNDWEPEFVDYLYFSFTNAAAFSPTDVMPLARWAKLMMMGQAAISIMLVVLVAADAVNALH